MKKLGLFIATGLLATACNGAPPPQHTMKNCDYYPVYGQQLYGHPYDQYGRVNTNQPLPCVEPLHKAPGLAHDTPRPVVPFYGYQGVNVKSR